MPRSSLALVAAASLLLLHTGCSEPPRPAPLAPQGAVIHGQIFGELDGRGQPVRRHNLSFVTVTLTVSRASPVPPRARSAPIGYACARGPFETTAAMST